MNKHKAVQTLMQVHACLDRVEWDADTLDRISQVLHNAGLPVREPAEDAVFVDDDTDDCDTLMCPQCDGASTPLGQLGNLTHYRCRQCGWTFDQRTADVSQRCQS